MSGARSNQRSAHRQYSIVKPAQADSLEERAAHELARYTQMLLGRPIRIVSDDASLPPAPGAHFLVGLPERNRVASRLLADGRLRILDELPEHPDAFIVASDEAAGGAKVIALAGRRPIGTLYAAYEYLETACRVGFFQDGEHVPCLDRLPVDGLRIVEQPRFDNRLHLCWNAHRAIKKYHAFWWTLDEWKREFDWMLKRRMNMLRLDMGYYSRFAGDAFQQAFPEIGPEPPDLLYPRFAGWVVEPGWPPEHRRALTQRILQYGRSLGIRFIYTLDYAAVPFRFKDVHPEYKYLPANQYGDSRQIAPDDPAAREVEKRHLAKLVELFGTDHLYMCTPYAELDVGAGSAERNLDMRIEASKGLLDLIREVDPRGIWVSDSWDMYARVRWNAARVKRYLGSFSADSMYLYETAADVAALHTKHNSWHGKPWAFGVLHSFAGKDTLHGNPHQLIRRVKVAAACPTCTGLFMVPESTHHNAMFWDLVTRLAWQPGDVEFDTFLEDFVIRRYGDEVAAPMLNAWRSIVRAVYKSPARGLIDCVYRKRPWYIWPDDCALFGRPKPKLHRRLRDIDDELPLLRDALRVMLRHRAALKDNPLYVEDVVAVFRSYAGKCFEREAGDAYLAFVAGKRKAFERHRGRAMKVLDTIPRVLSACPSYSINKTIAEACAVEGRHPRLPELIRQACINVGYVNNDVYEQFPGQYIPKTNAYFACLARKLDERKHTVTRRDLKADFDRISTAYRELGWSGPSRAGDPVALVALVARCLGKLATDRLAPRRRP